MPQSNLVDTLEAVVHFDMSHAVDNSRKHNYRFGMSSESVLASDKVDSVRRNRVRFRRLSESTPTASRCCSADTARPYAFAAAPVRPTFRNAVSRSRREIGRSFDSLSKATSPCSPMTLLRAYSDDRSCTPTMAAALHNSFKSLPEYPAVACASSGTKALASASNASPCNNKSKMARRPTSLGSGT